MPCEVAAVNYGAEIDFSERRRCNGLSKCLPFPLCQSPNYITTKNVCGGLTSRL